MDLNHACDQRLVVFAQFSDHVQRFHIFRVVVGDVFKTSHVPDRANRGSAQLANSFGNVVCHCEYLLNLFIKQQMIATKMWATDMPVEILRLDVNSENICEEDVELRSEVPHVLRAQIRRRSQGSFTSLCNSASGRHVVSFKK